MTDLATAHDARRDEIVVAARACFRRWGLAKTTMDDIATEVGIVRPNLYRYFPTKAAIVSAVSTAESHRINAHRRERIEIEGPVASIIEASIIMGIELALVDGHLSELMMRENGALAAATVEASEARREYWRPIFEHGRRRGELRTDVTDDDLVRWLGGSSTSSAIGTCTRPSTRSAGRSACSWSRR